MAVIVVDTSLAIKWVVTEAHSTEATTFLVYCTEQNVDLIAPMLFQHEAISVLAKKIREGLSLPDAKRAIADMLAVMECRTFDSALIQRSIDLAAALPSRFGFDLQFIALAEAERCEFWTADEKLISELVKHPMLITVPVQWVGEFVAPSP